MKFLIPFVLIFVFGLSFVSAEGKAPDFHFLNQDQKPITLEDFKGQYLAINFFFTSCPSICPMINGKVFTLYKKFEKNTNLRFLSVSVDPERDTFQVLKNYSQKFDIDSNRWQFARGEKALVHQFVADLKLSAGGTIDQHNTRLTLINPEGTIVGYYSMVDAEGFQQAEEKLLEIFNTIN